MPKSEEQREEAGRQELEGAPLKESDPVDHGAATKNLNN